MGRYRAADLARVPSLLSLSRLGFAAAFPFVLASPRWALVLLAAAGLSDVLDGWYARRFGQVTATGAVVDPVTDKLFVLTVAVSLVVHGYFSPLTVVLLSTREIGELPLVVWLVVSRHGRLRRASQPSANVPGKLATVLQFLTAGAALLGWTHLNVAVGTTAVAGAVAAASYWWRLRE